MPSTASTRIPPSSTELHGLRYVDIRPVPWKMVATSNIHCNLIPNKYVEAERLRFYSLCCRWNVVGSDLTEQCGTVRRQLGVGSVRGTSFPTWVMMSCGRPSFFKYLWLTLPFLYHLLFLFPCYHKSLIWIVTKVGFCFSGINFINN